MLKFRRGRSSGSYSVTPLKGEEGDGGTYTLVNRESLSLPATPSSSFRETIRRSIRKIRRKKDVGERGRTRERDEGKRAKKKAKKGAEYEVIMAYTKEDIQGLSTSDNAPMAYTKEDIQGLSTSDNASKRTDKENSLELSQEYSEMIKESENRNIEKEISKRDDATDNSNEQNTMKSEELSNDKIMTEEDEIVQLRKNTPKEGKKKHTLLSEIESEILQKNDAILEEDDEFRCLPLNIKYASLARAKVPGSRLKKRNEQVPRGPFGDLLKQKNDAAASSKSIKKAIVHDENIEDILNDIKETLPSCDDVVVLGVDQSDEIVGLKYAVQHVVPEQDGEQRRQSDKFEHEHKSQIHRKLSRSETCLEDGGVGSPLSMTAAMVTHSRKAERPPELDLEAGDIVFLHNRLGPDWYDGESRGVRGILPAAFLKLLVDTKQDKGVVRAVAIADYKPRSPVELKLEAGQLVYLTHRLDYHWYQATVQGAKGVVPAAFLTILAAAPGGSIGEAVRDRRRDTIQDVGDLRRDKMGQTEGGRRRDVVGEDWRRDRIGQLEGDRRMDVIAEERWRGAMEKVGDRKRDIGRERIMKDIGRRTETIQFI